jgi:hypothetical protein
MTAKSSTSSTVAAATISTAEPEVNEASRTVTPFTQKKSEVVELDGRKPASATADAPPFDGLVASWLEPPVRKANEEQLPFTDLGAMRGGAGVEWAPSKIDGGITVGFSPLPTKDGATISTTQPKANEVTTAVASLAKEEKRAVESDGSKLPVAGTESPTLNVVSSLQPPIHKAAQRPAAPGGLKILVSQ